jgi:hypothetical protein
MPTPTYFVKNGNTLGYIYAETPGSFEVLHGSVILGGDDWKNGSVALSPIDKLVPATLADFDKFRVCSKGHIA